MAKKQFSTMETPIIKKFAEDLELTLNEATQWQFNVLNHLRASTLVSLRGKFEYNEIIALVANLNGTLITSDTVNMICDPNILAHHFSEGCLYEGIDNQFNVSQQTVVSKILNLSPTECYFLQEAILRFWAKSNDEKNGVENFAKSLC